MTILGNQSLHTLRKSFLVGMIILCLFGKAISQNPVANFTANTTSGCGPLTVSFTDQSTGNPTTWNWEFSNGTLSNAQNPTVTFASPGTYSVKLVIQNATGIAQFERIDYITVFAAPVPAFRANNTLICVPGVVTFTDFSTTPVGTITSWSWDFGDGGTSTLQNPTHTYTNQGFYTIVLTVTSSTGCTKSAVAGSYIRVIGGVTTDFNFTAPRTCTGPFTVNFQNQSSGPGTISYNWNFGNGQTSNAANPTAIYASPGTYTVTLNTQSNLGCTGSIQKTVTIGTTTTDFTAPINICLNQPTSFQNNSNPPPVSSTWDFGDGTVSGQINPVKTFLAPGPYSVKLINRYAGCVDSITKTVTVTDKPVVDFMSNDSTFCQAPSTVQFTDLTSGSTSWFWDFGDGTTSTQQNPSHQYTATGDYDVTLTATTGTGCTNTTTKTAFIRIHEPVITLNLPTGGCVPFSYTPTATVLTLDSVASYSWNLGAPGAIFNVKNPPPYTYASVGSYDVSLTITTVSGCTKTFTAVNGVRVGTPPTVSFTATPTVACASQPITFVNNSITSPGAFVEWAWDFGDNTGSNIRDPQHVFTDTGALTIRLTVTNNGCASSATTLLQINPPVAGFRYAVNCNTRQVTFTDTSLVNPGLAPLTWAWDFGNGTTSTLQNPPPVTYTPSPTPYTVTLIVTNGTCSYTSIQPVQINNEPADFSINKNPNCQDEVFTLSAINSNPANIASYEWTVAGTVLPATTRTVSYKLPANGTYDVTLTLTDLNGCISTKTIANYIRITGPVALFAPASPGACLNKPTTFNDLSTPAGTITNWDFIFGDGTQQSFTSGPFTHIYALQGGFNVTLKVTDAAGCSDTYTRITDFVVTNPTVGFKADTFYCPQAALPFTDTSSGAGLSYLWTFGDGTTSTLANPQHLYPAGDADYTVKLRITDISGCSDSISKPAYIKIRQPKAAFSIKDTTTICPPLRTSFTFQGSDYQSYSWAFGDGGLSTQQNPSYFYGGYGTFIPTLYVVGPGGCVDSAKSSVTVHNPNSVRINYGPPTTACNSLNVDFNLVMPAGFKFIFYFGDGTADSTRRTSFSHLYPKPSLSSPYVVIYDSISGCQTTVGASPRIDVLGAIPLFGLDKPQFCDNGVVTFTDFTTKNEPIISTTWNFGDGTTSNVQSPTHNYTQPGVYLVRLDITTQSNCSSSYTDTVLVYRTPVPIIQSRDTICVNVAEPFTGLTAVPDSVTNWSWNFANGQISNAQNNTATYTTTGPYTIQLISSNLIGCSDTTTKTIFVSPTPTVTATQDLVTIISGGSATLPMTYTGNIISYNWTPQYRLDCLTCPTPTANPQSSTRYKVSVEDVYGCRSSGDVNVLVLCNNQNFFIPNTFSPNGDGKNEVFYPRGTGLFRIKSMTVFNRWGQIVFDRKGFAVNDAAQGWNGTFKGQPASADVYVYLIEIICDNNQVIPVKGNVTLLR